MTYSVTIHIANRGTPLKKGGTSSVGHMWYEINDYKSKPKSYGFAPLEHGKAFGKGHVYDDDSDNYLSTSYSRTIEITKEQYERLKDFGEHSSNYGFDGDYNGLWNSCIDFTWRALNVGGINPVKDFDGMLWPTWNESRSNMLPGSEPLFPYGDDGYQCLKPWVEQPPRTNKAHGYDPLILNLDGKGIQTLTPSSISARFDHNADGIATATGWTAAGNGILALDLDKNGKIDSGKEIFGNHSVLSNGATAAHGYAALAELDSNHDNLINQADELFSSLKVWQDINQDGISQANELFTLQALGIQSLNLEYQENSKDLGNGNRLTHIGSYTKIDGTTGEMGDVEFASNSLYSRYTDTVKLTPEQLQAPNLQGLGRLRDLCLVTLN